MELLERIVGNCALYRHRVVADERGSLVALEQPTLPFAIRRVYFLYSSAPDSERGFHAHKALQQWAVCVSGSCVMTVDDSVERREVVLDTPDKGLYIGPGIWREMRNFSDGAVLMVLASAPYDEADYIRDYDEFRRFMDRGTE
jgi:dTDP-4-dehydrorhamnose 3,5-epimerase